MKLSNPNTVCKLSKNEAAKKQATKKRLQREATQPRGLQEKIAAVLEAFIATRPIGDFSRSY